MKRGKVVAAVVRVEEEQDGSTIFGTLFDLPSERKTTKPVDLPPPVYKATKPVDLPPSVLENTRPVDLPPSVNNDAGPPHKECTVCLDTLSKSLFPESLHAEQQHDSDVCSSCYDEHIEAELDNKSPDLISCPQCPHTLTEPEVRKLMQRTATHQKYDCPAIFNTRLGRVQLLTSEVDTATSLRRHTSNKMKSSTLARMPLALGVRCVSNLLWRFSLLT
jgi:hypothetical protein